MSELIVTAGWLAQAAGGRVRSGSASAQVGRIVTDSRRLVEGDFFIALRGARHDGHAFVDEALKRGALGVLVDATYAASMPVAPADALVVEADDTTAALQRIGNAVRRASGAKVVAITGSAGKTTTKEIIAALLATRWRVVKNEGNLNNHIGLPLSLLQLRTRPDVAVMELGMNHAGEISALVAIAEPDVRVWTNVGDAHVGFFDSPDGIADAKAEIIERASSDTLLVYNADDARVRSRVAGFPGRSMTFGFADGADVRAVDVRDAGIDGTRARLTTPAGECEIALPLVGRGNLANLLAATAVALDFGVSLEAIVERTARLNAADRRGVVRRLGRGVTLIDDSYNSSPAAVKRALEVLAASRTAGRRVAVLGEMLELGSHAPELHAECGRASAAASLDLLIGVGGPVVNELVDAAVAAGMGRPRVRRFATSDEAARAVPSTLAPGDLVLVKGSRGIRTDLVADAIAAEWS